MQTWNLKKRHLASKITKDPSQWLIFSISKFLDFVVFVRGTVIAAKRLRSNVIVRNIGHWTNTKKKRTTFKNHDTWFTIYLFNNIYCKILMKNLQNRNGGESFVFMAGTTHIRLKWNIYQIVLIKDRYWTHTFHDRKRIIP